MSRAATSGAPRTAEDGVAVQQGRLEQWTDTPVQAAVSWMVCSGGPRTGFERHARCARNCAPPAVRLVSAPGERYERSFPTHCRCAPSASALRPRPTATPHFACSHHNLSGGGRRACHGGHRAQGRRATPLGRRHCLPVGTARPSTDGQPRLSARPGESGWGGQVEGRARRVGGAARRVRGNTPATRQRSRGRPGRPALLLRAPRIQTAASRSSSPRSRLLLLPATPFRSLLPTFGFFQDPPPSPFECWPRLSGLHGPVEPP